MFEHDNCLKCKKVPCINLYEPKEDWPQEMYLLEKFSRSLENNLHPPCVLGVVMFSLCKLLRVQWESFKRQEINALSAPFHLQALRDLKAIILLILTGHYKAAISLLRGVIELYLIGLYFDYKLLNTNTKIERDVVIRKVKTYIKTEEYKVPHEDIVNVNTRKYTNKDGLNYLFLSEFLVKNKAIKGKAKNRMEKLWGELNRYVHSKELESPEKGFPVCPAAVKIIPKEYDKCIEFFQRGVAIIIKILLDFYYRKHKLIEQEGLAEIIDWIIKLENIEKDLKGTVKKVLYSSEFRNLIHDLKKELNI